MRICIIGDSEDLSSVYVAWLARQRGIEVITLREEKLGVEWAYSFDDLRAQEGHIEVAGTSYLVSELSGAFVRLHPQPALPPGLDLPAEERGAFITERRGAIHYLLNNLPSVVANRPYSGRSNASKPYQMRLLANAGFEVPKWVVTNEQTTVMEFSSKCSHGVIYKACSGLRSKVRLLDEEVLHRLEDGTTPIVVQEYIKGRDVRVHTVNHRIFATEVLSGGVDYRFHGETNEFRPTSVPSPIEELCYKVTDSEGLTLAGFDFRVSDDGHWYCLEVNPVPTFLPYEMSTGQAIGSALLDVLGGHYGS